jgi:hypothetical protein
VQIYNIQLNFYNQEHEQNTLLEIEMVLVIMITPAAVSASYKFSPEKIRQERDECNNQGIIPE